MDRSSRIKGFLSAHAAELTALAATCAGLAAYLTWAFGRTESTLHGMASAAVCFGLFMLGILLCIPRAVRFLKGESETAPIDLMGERSRRRLHPTVRIMLMVLACHVIVVFAAYAVYTIAYGYRGSVFSTLKAVWYKSDTDIQHYFNIAENWYSTEFPDAWVLVFLPFYSLCIRAANFIFGDSFVSGFVLNIIFSAAAGAVLYELALCDMGRRSSRFAVFCAFALPAAIFYVAPMSDALFLLLSASALLAMRKNRFLWAGVFGALASFTRSLGIVLLVPYAAEAAAYCVRLYKDESSLHDKDYARKKLAGRIITIALCALLLCSGFGAYLLINKLLWGDWFKFLELQKQNWSQSLGWFFNTASYQTELLVSRIQEGDTQTALGLWLPNLLYIFGSLAVFAATARELRTSYVLYFAAYFAVAIGATWLLSAPRYLTALAVLPIAVAKLCESFDDGRGLTRARAKSAVVAAVFLIGQVIYLVFYVLRYKLY